MRSRRVRARSRALFSVGGILVCCALGAKERRVAADERPATTLETPRAFGTDSYTVTTVSAVAFYPDQRYYHYGTTADLSRYGEVQTVENFFTKLELPAGAIIDYIGLNGVSPAPFALGVALDERRSDGVIYQVASFDSTQHGMDTAFNTTPIGFPSPGRRELIIKVQQGAFDVPPVFGWVEVWWKRSVSDPTNGPSFSDVLPSHPFYQFIEALYAAGITGGCGNFNYCPDAPLTRGQMAVFLAKALGLHWPGN